MKATRSHKIIAVALSLVPAEAGTVMNNASG